MLAQALGNPFPKSRLLEAGDIILRGLAVLRILRLLTGIDRAGLAVWVKGRPRRRSRITGGVGRGGAAA
jgi:hypothetical protein